MSSSSDDATSDAANNPSDDACSHVVSLVDHALRATASGAGLVLNVPAWYSGSKVVTEGTSQTLQDQYAQWSRSSLLQKVETSVQDYFHPQLSTISANNFPSDGNSVGGSINPVSFWKQWRTQGASDVRQPISTSSDSSQPLTFSTPSPAYPTDSTGPTTDVGDSAVAYPSSTSWDPSAPSIHSPLWQPPNTSVGNTRDMPSTVSADVDLYSSSENGLSEPSPLPSLPIFGAVSNRYATIGSSSLDNIGDPSQSPSASAADDTGSLAAAPFDNPSLAQYLPTNDGSSGTSIVDCFGSFNASDPYSALTSSVAMLNLNGGAYDINNLESFLQSSGFANGDPAMLASLQQQVQGIEAQYGVDISEPSIASFGDVDQVTPSYDPQSAYDDGASYVSYDQSTSLDDGDEY
jgi:hypothetical protein